MLSRAPGRGLLPRLLPPLLLLLSIPTLLGGFEAGIAVRIVTPDPLLPVSGGLGPSQPVRKKEGDLTVRALVLSDGTTRVAMVSTDFLGFPCVLAERVRQRVRDIPARNILIGAPHTHSAPDIYGFPDHAGRFSTDLNYVDSVVTRVAEAIDEAWTRRQPARLKDAASRGVSLHVLRSNTVAQIQQFLREYFDVGDDATAHEAALSVGERASGEVFEAVTSHLNTPVKSLLLNVCPINLSVSS